VKNPETSRSSVVVPLSVFTIFSISAGRTPPLSVRTPRFLGAPFSFAVPLGTSVSEFLVVSRRSLFAVSLSPVSPPVPVVVAQEIPPDVFPNVVSLPLPGPIFALSFYVSWTVVGRRRRRRCCSRLNRVGRKPLLTNNHISAEIRLDRAF
jgi:hypothetical protein